MTDNKFGEIHTKRVERTYVKLNGNEYPVEYVIEVLYELHGTDGFTSSVAVVDYPHQDIAEDLEELGIIKSTIRGGFYEPDNVNLAEEARTLMERTRR